MSEEILITYDAFNNPIGSADRKKVHTQGLWHRSANFIVLDPKKRTVIFQDSNTLDAYDAEKFFVKMNGGHVHGEDMIQGVARELREEFGLLLEEADKVHFLGTYQISFEPTADFINHEFMYFYLTVFSNALEKIVMDRNEVKSVFEISIDTAVEVLVGNRDVTQAYARDIDGKEITANLTRDSFKNFTDDSLYLRLFLAAQDFCNGKNEKYIVI
jgi:isopentenyldiphosphate isomerase